MNEKTYLVEVLLRAREQISQVAQRAAKALDSVTAAQERMGDSSRGQVPKLRDQITALEQLVAAHIREKKALEDSSAVFRFRANARKADADAARRSLEDLQRQARIERALADEKKKRDIEEISRIRLEIAEREAADVAQDKAYKNETSRLRKEANLLKALADENAAANQRRAAETAVQIADTQQQTRETIRAAAIAERSARVEEVAHEKVSRSIATNTRQLDTLRERFNRSNADTTRFGRALDRLGLSGGNASKGLRGLNAEFQGLAIALAIKYAQSLITVLAGLAAQFVAVAAAAGQAAAGIAGALGAGAAQAVPVVGVLVASFARLAAVLKVVKLQNQEQLRASQEAQTAARARRTATDQVTSAEERVADAHRNTARAVQQLSQARSQAAREEARAQADAARAQADADRSVRRAQQGVTQARKDAIRTVEDLIAAEKESVLSVENAQSALRRALREGDVAGAAQAQLDVGTAQRGLTRARQDAAPVRARGVEGVQGVIDAEQRLAEVRRQGTRQAADAEQRLADVRRGNDRQLASAAQSVADAQRQEAGAARDLSRTRREAKENLDQETASVNKLHDALMQLSPAERQLYERVLALQGVYRRVARPITDILTGAFTDVVDVTIRKLQDPRIIAGFRSIAVQIAAAIRAGTREAGGRESTSAFEVFSAEATRNIPIVTGIVLRFFRTARALALDAIPAFRQLLGYVADYARALEDFVTRNPRALRDFFSTGIDYAKRFFDLGLAVIRLFLALGGQGGAAAEGAATIDYLRERVEALTQKVRDNAGEIRRFFARSREVIAPILDVLATLGLAIVQVFDPDSVRALADFINHILIPAFAATIQILGALVKVFHQLLTLPGVEQLAQVAATVLVLAKALTVVRLAILDILTIIPNFLRAMGLMVGAEEAAAAGLGFFAAMTPVGWVVLAIAAVVAAIVLLNKKLHFLGPTFEWLKNAAVDAFHWLVQAGKDVISWFSDVWTQGLLHWLLLPYLLFARWLTTSGPGKRILRTFGEVIAFFASEQWAVIKAAIVAPFEIALAALNVIWGLIQTTVLVTLDIISGRFDRIGEHISGIWEGVWENVLSASQGALNALIDMVNTAIDAINKVSPFKDIGHIAHVGDDVKEQLDKVGAASDDAVKKQDKFADSAEKTSNRVNTAMDSTATTAKEDFGKVEDSAGVGVKAFQDLLDAGRGSLRDIRQITRITMEDIAGRLGKDSLEGKQALAKNFRDAAQAVKDQMDAGRISTRNGMRAIRSFLTQELQVYGLSLRSARNILKGGPGGGQFGDTDNNLGREGGASLIMGRAGGGMVSAYGGWPRDDHVVVDPYGRPSARVSGNEGIVNPPQMDRINQWGSIVKGLGLDSYGSLDELWGMRGGGRIGGHSSRLRRFQGGGFLQLPASLTVAPHPTSGLTGYPANDVFGAPGTRVGSPVTGRVVKLSGQAGGPGGGGAYGYSIYITGGGRTYYLTHMGSRTVRLGQTVRRGQVIGTIADYPDRPDHIHEGIHGGGMSVQGSATSAGMVVPLRLVPRPRITGGGAVGRSVQRALRLATVGANNLLRGAAGAPEAGPATVGRVINVRGAGLQSVNRVFPLHHTGTPGAQLSRSTVQRIAASVGFPPVAGEQISRGESGNQPGIVEWPPEADGAQGIGLMQMTTGHVDPPVVALINRLGGWSQMRNPIKNFIAAEKLREIGGLGRWHGTRFLTGYRRGGLLSLPRFQNGGPIATAAAARRPVRVPRPVKAPIDALAGIVGTVNSLFTDVLGDLRKMVGGLDKTKGLAKRIRVASEKLTEDDGVLDTLHEAVAGIATRGALALQRAQFRVTRGGRPIRRDLTAAEVARAGVVTTQATGEALAGERTTLQTSIANEQRALNVAVKNKNKAAQTAARAALANLRTRLEQNATDIAQNAQDQVEAVESYQQALLDAVNQHADNANARLDRATRTARALGVALDPNAVIDRQIATTRTQIAGLQEVLRTARRSHNTELVGTVSAQIAELNVQIAEAVAQQFQNAIDAVNTTAQQQTTRLDRAARRAQIGGTNYAALGDTFVARQGVLANQRAGLAALLIQATAAGNIDQITNLTDQIDDLDTTMAENTQAIKDNTDAAFNDRTQRVNEQFGFAQTVLTGAQGFFQGLTDATGISTLPQQLSALRSLATALGTQQQGLESQLAALIGDQSVLGLTGTGLVDYLLSISTGPRMQAIMNMLDPTQQAAFRDLVTSLLTNTSATQENTKAIGDLTGANAQSFTSSFWTSFRTAIFTGAGGLLPTYAMTIPGAAIGARVMTSGALMVHAGETVRPAVVSRNVGGDSGDTYVVNVTSPTQVLDPVHVNRELAFLRKTSGR